MNILYIRLFFHLFILELELSNSISGYIRHGGHFGQRCSRYRTTNETINPAKDTKKPSSINRLLSKFIYS